MSSFLLTALLSGVLPACSPGVPAGGNGAELLYGYKLSDQRGPGIYHGMVQKQKTLNRYIAMIEDLSTLPVSFIYDGIEFRGLDTGKNGAFKEKSRRTTLSEDGRKVSTAIDLSFRDSIAVTLETAIYPDYCAYEWTVWFENKGSAETAVLEDLYSADMVLEGADPVLKGIYGDGGIKNGCPYEPYEIPLTKGKKVSMTPETGRSTYNYFPYFNLQYGNGGKFAAIGWPIMWGATFEHVDGAADGGTEGLRFRAGQKYFSTTLKPGEKIRTPMTVLLDYDGRVDSVAANLWRHWFIDCNMRRPGGELFEPNISGCTSGMYGEMVAANEANQIEAIQTYLSHDVPLTYWWMDAGWYFEYGEKSLDVWLPTGTWMVDTKRFPTRFKSISDLAAAHDMKTLLWFEPEVVRLEERLRDADNGIPARFMLDSVLANMGDPEFIDWMVERVSGIITEGGISLYRQDYGINPAGNFMAQNTPGRTGIIENKYAQGYYAYWDKLIERFPGMMIDSCAAGGGRNDIESMRRAVPLHKTDYDYTNNEDKQSMHMALYAWFPYFGSTLVGGTVDPYIMRTNYTPWVNMSLSIDSRTLKWNTLSSYLQEWTQLSSCIYSDYYPLTGWSRGRTEWRAWEFYSPETGEGFAEFFRPDEAPQDSLHVTLKGLEPAATYAVRNPDTGIVTRATGQELTEQGIELTLKPRSTAVLTIRRE